MAFSLADYELSAEIGSGAFGHVYKAIQKSLGRPVAIKRLAPHRIADQEAILRFRREAQAMAALSHENIVTVYEYGIHEGNYYLVMEYVDGITFEEHLGNKADCMASLAIATRVCSAVACAHEKNIIHRDIKPSNVLLGTDGRVKLTDFGLASVRDSLPALSHGAPVGTIVYMAPEMLVSPRDVDYRADIYALGCLLYRILSGRLPFDGDSLAAVSYGVLNTVPPPLDCTGQLAELAATVMVCLDKDRDLRPSLAHLLTTLGTATGSTTSTRQWAPPPPRLAAVPRYRLKRIQIAIGVAAFAVLSGTLALLFRPTPPRVIQPLLPSLAYGVDLIPDPTTESESPAPLVDNSRSIAPATVFIAGARPSDTIFVNDSAVVPLTAGALKQLYLAPGNYRIRIGSSTYTRHNRTLDLLPYQRVTLDLTPKDSNP